jgi:hypothetical protein
VLPASVVQAIHRLIEDANGSDLPIVDVTASAAKLAASLPEAAALGLPRLSDEIAFAASRDSRVGLTINQAA